MRATIEKVKSVDEVLAEKQHIHNEDVIKCTGKDCLGKDDHVMKPSGQNKVKCTSCGEERLLIKPHQKLRECPHCKEFFPAGQRYEDCPYCGKEV